MANGRSVGAIATAALLLIVASACSHGGADPAASGPSTPASPRSSAATTAAPTETEAASERASELVRTYFDVLDALRQHPAQPLSALSKVATSLELSADKTLLRRERSRGQRQVGDTELLRLEVQSINLDDSDPQLGKVPTVQVDVCWNVADVDVIDKRRKSVVSPSRPDQGWIRFTVANYHWSANPTGGWRVASSQDLRQTPCAPS